VGPIVYSPNEREIVGRERCQPLKTRKDPFKYNKTKLMHAKIIFELNKQLKT